MALTRDDLDKMVHARNNGMDTLPLLYLGARCHPLAATFVNYDTRSGCVILQCKACNEMVAEIAVAAQSHPDSHGKSVLPPLGRKP